ncbi:MAG: hypothetical protein WCL32_23145 [Planctomycetota bacterium]
MNPAFSRPWMTLFATLGCLLPTGCTSITSTLYSHDGCQNCVPVKKHLKGVPTTLEVPTHLQLSVLRSRYGKVTDEGVVVFEPQLETREVATDFVTQKEIFTVDFKRPAAGSLKYKLDFDVGKQYITGVTNESEDKTIAAVTTLITTVIKQIPPIRVREESVATSQFTEFRDVVAMELFAVNEPGLEERIQAFLNIYVNNCHALCPPSQIPPPPPPCSACGDGHKCSHRP